MCTDRTHEKYTEISDRYKKDVKIYEDEIIELTAALERENDAFEKEHLKKRLNESIRVLESVNKKLGNFQ